MIASLLWTVVSAAWSPQSQQQQQSGGPGIQLGNDIKGDGSGSGGGNADLTNQGCYDVLAAFSPESITPWVCDQNDALACLTQAVRQVETNLSAGRCSGHACYLPDLPSQLQALEAKLHRMDLQPNHPGCTSPWTAQMGKLTGLLVAKSSACHLDYWALTRLMEAVSESVSRERACLQSNQPVPPMQPTTPPQINISLDSKSSSESLAQYEAQLIVERNELVRQRRTIASNLSWLHQQLAEVESRQLIQQLNNQSTVFSQQDYQVQVQIQRLEEQKIFAERRIEETSELIEKVELLRVESLQRANGGSADCEELLRQLAVRRRRARLRYRKNPSASNYHRLVLASERLHQARRHCHHCHHESHCPPYDRQRCHEEDDTVALQHEFDVVNARYLDSPDSCNRMAYARALHRLNETQTPYPSHSGRTCREESIRTLRQASRAAEQQYRDLPSDEARTARNESRAALNLREKHCGLPLTEWPHIEQEEHESWSWEADDSPESYTTQEEWIVEQ